MSKAELESKHLAELHALAAEAGVDGYRMLSRAELIERLSENGGRAETRDRERQRRRPRERRPREPRPERERSAEREPRAEREPAAGAPPSAQAEGERPRRRRRRRRFRRRRSLRAHELLLPTVSGRQAVVYGDSRESCSELLRSLTAELARASKGPEPIAVLVDPSPEELADWRRDAPGAEIVAAGKGQHVEDAVAQAARRADQGEQVIVVVDSLTRFAADYGDADGAREIFDAGLGASRSGDGSLTVVAGLQRSD